MADRSPLDDFKAVLGGAARAIAREPEVELTFTADAPVQSGRHMKVPMPGRSLPAEQVAEARGFADGFALRLRHHDTALHARTAPAEAVARAVFDAIETARVEALGARAMAGVRANLAQSLALRMKSDPIVRARNRDEVPLSTALQLIVRERLTGEAPPAAAESGLAMVRDWIEDKGAAELDALGMLVDDQSAYARLATRLLEDLELIEGDLTPDDEDGDGSQDEGEDEKNQDDTDDADEGDGGADGEVEMRAEPSDGEQDQSETESFQDEADGESDGEPGDAGEEGMLPVRPNRPLSDMPPQFDYKAWTTQFDEVVGAFVDDVAQVVEASWVLRTSGRQPMLARLATFPGAGRKAQYLDLHAAPLERTRHDVRRDRRD